MKASPRLGIADYYITAAVNSFAATLFVYCGYFWAEDTFHYSAEWTLSMGAAQGVVSVISAYLGGRLGDRLGYDRILKTTMPMLVAILLAGAWLNWTWTPMVFTTVYLAVITTTWPNVEASILHAPARSSIPMRLGLYNIVWGTTSTIGFLASGWLYRWQPSSILWIPAILHGLLWLWMNRPKRQGIAADAVSAMELPHATAHLPADEKSRFVLTALVGNAVAYLIVQGYLSIAPVVGKGLGLDASQSIWLNTILLAGRTAAFLAFWIWEGWHYRRSWSLAPLWIAPVCLAGMIYLNHPLVVGILLGLLGLAVGLTYYGSIFYSLDSSDHKGQGGGRHEAVLGLGILAGPLVGAIGTRLGDGVAGAKIAILSLAALMTLLTSLPLLAARRPR